MFWNSLSRCRHQITYPTTTTLQLAMAQPGVCGVMHGGTMELSKQKKKQELTSEVLASVLSAKLYL